MTQIIDKNLCCGCSACYSVCSHSAITMKLDKEGFEYPFIDQDACVDCRLCKNVCPVLQYENNGHKRSASNDIQRGVVARNNNYEQRIISSSGGIFPSIAEFIINQGGVVIGAAYDENWNVVHKIVDKKEDLIHLQGSKYIQCKADNSTFKIIRKELLKGRKVLYAALACQVEGLKSYLMKEYDNLYTIDLICMGIPSYVVWQKYLDAFFNGENITAVNFKEKSRGWDNFSCRIETDRRVFKEKGMDNLYLRSMFLSWNMRPSCFNCPFKHEQRFSDFTLADAWGVYRLTPQINDNKGLSSVIIHSSKGLRLWEELGEKIDSADVSIEEIAKGNSNLISNKTMSGDRALFYRLLDENPRKAFVELCSIKKPSILSRILNIIRHLLNRFGSLL